MNYLVGADEVGRGCAAGPILGCAVYIIQDNIEILKKLGVKDSKKFSSKEKLYTITSKIFKYLEYKRFECNVEDIDKYGIDFCNKEVLAISIKDLSKNNLFNKCYIDGNIEVNVKGVNCINLIGGDNLNIAIASASMIAKTARDSYMKKLHLEYPEYDWINNVGYLTNKHIEAIKKYGITEYHRKSFIKKYL